MTTAPGRAGRRAACGLAAVIATISTVLASEPPASAAISTKSPHPRRAVVERNIRHERRLLNTGQAPKAARPQAIAIPSIGMVAALVPLGGPDGRTSANSLLLPVPPLARAATEAGWYEFTPAPGMPGNAVIVGHVDTYAGPAVFYNLYRLRPDDRIYVDTGGTRQRFDVASVRELPKPDFPVNRVFGSTERHMLWLITCGGAFDYETRHYLDNIFVSATWVPSSDNHPDKKTGAKRSVNHPATVR